MKIEINLSDDDIKTLDFLEDFLGITCFDAYVFNYPDIEKFHKCRNLIERIKEEIDE